MNRSSCASGSGYVPSCSIGFCVASTKNGSGSRCVWPAAVTACSCIACSSAACVFGGARLISSASTTFAKIGPFANLKNAAPGRVILLEQLGAGDVARHQVRRELHAREAQVERLRHRLHEQRLREAGHADEQHVAAGEQRGDEIVDDLVLADDAPPDLLDQRRARARELLEQLDVA